MNSNEIKLDFGVHIEKGDAIINYTRDRSIFPNSCLDFFSSLRNKLTKNKLT